MYYESIIEISHESIYQRAYADKPAGGTLHTFVRCQKKRRKRYKSGRSRCGQIPGRVGIEEKRSPPVEQRSTIDHWEGYTVIGKGHKRAIVTLVERKSRYTLLYAVRRKTTQRGVNSNVTANDRYSCFGAYRDLCEL